MHKTRLDQDLIFKYKDQFMKYIVTIALTIISFLLKSQTMTQSEKMIVHLDSIVKADNIKVIGIYAYKNYNDNIIEQIIESSQTFEFKGQFIVLTDSENFLKYFNIEKLINFTVFKKDKKIRLFFQVH